MKLILIAVLLAALLSPRASSPRASPVEAGPATAEDYRTEQLLRTTALPPRNLYELYPRLRGTAGEELQRVVGSTQGWRTGTREQFWVSNLQTREYRRRSAVLQFISTSAYWFVEEGRTYSQAALQQAAQRFDSVAALNRKTFGSEWRPGVDADPRLVVLIASTPGAGGYYSSTDEYPRSINPYSNEHEMIYIDADPGEPYFDATLAHEFQHMIHWNEHSNQDVWLNEGMSEYAVELNGYNSGLPEAAFAAAPDTQLNTWTDHPATASAHYGQAYRFMSYLGGRYGPAFMREIIDSPGTGLNAVDQAVRGRSPGTTLYSVYGDWLAANLFVNGSSGPLSYTRRMTPVQTEKAYDGFSSRATVSQWGADYYALQDNSPYAIEFAGAPRVKLMSNEPRSGNFQWYSNRGDLLDSTLTRDLDLSNVSRASLEIDLWYDIEEHFDYAYVEISPDGGETWDTLRGRRTTNDNPNGNNLGNGLTGKSDGWVIERFDLAPYVGQKALLRIEYVTDDGYNAQGIAVDGVRVPEIGLADDSERPNGWRSEGWIRTNNWLPGRYRLLLLEPDGGGSYTEVPVGADGRAMAVMAQGAGRPPAIVVSGTAQTTTQASEYRLSVQRHLPGTLGIMGARVQLAATP